MGRIPQAIAQCGARYGLELRLNTLVTRILVRGGRAVGVVLADGTEITAREIVSNVNARLLCLDLIGAEHLPRLAVHGIKSYEPSLTSPMVYLGVD